MDPWATRKLWIGRKRRIGLSRWMTPYGPTLAKMLGGWSPPLLERWPSGGALRTPLTRWCLTTYRRDR